MLPCQGGKIRVCHLLRATYSDGDDGRYGQIVRPENMARVRTNRLQGTQRAFYRGPRNGGEENAQQRALRDRTGCKGKHLSKPGNGANVRAMRFIDQRDQNVNVKKVGRCRTATPRP